MKKDTVCRMCSSCCPVEVEVVAGKLVSAQRKSFLSQDKRSPCLKLQAAADIVYSDKRLTTPLVRKKDGSFCEASWDEALDLVASRFHHYKKQTHPEAVGWLRGMAADWGSPWDYANRLMNCYGSPNTIGNGSICFVAREMAHTYTYGAMAFPEAAKARCILVCGKHDADTTLGVADAINHALSNGAKLIVVDPIKTPLARKADIWLQIKPGHDGLLAMAMINEIISQNLHDHEFVEGFTTGFNQLQEAASRYPVDMVAPGIWLDPQQVREAAHLYATTRPACLIDGNGLDMQLDIFQSTRAVACLRGLTGNIDRPGGDVLPQPIPLRPFQARDRLPAGVAPITIDYPLFNTFSESWGNQVQSCVVDAIHDQKPYGLKMLVVQAGNPVVTMADSGRAYRAMQELEFLVVIDLFMTRTAELADVILPAAGCFEKTQLNRAATRNNPIILQNQVIEPVGQSWPDWKIVFELGRRIGLEQEFPWPTVEAAIDEQLAPAGVTVERLRQNPEGVRVEGLRHEKYRQDGFATPSGKFEFFSRRLQENGHAGVPYAYGFPEKAISFGERQEDFPLIGISGRRDIRFTNSQYRIIPALLKDEEGCVVDIHPVDAAKQQIEDDDQLQITTPKGTITMRARVSSVVHPGSVRIAWGWGDYKAEYNLNTLTDDAVRNPITGTPGQRTFMCRVSKVCCLPG
ncbi:MAG: molybdopterin-dependent oxidoreductase [Deltaproteobacteria bacterium]|nr:molybdopterin-dependent oxidoreductase [Deltaproteobacteria bacterium]